MTGDSSLRRSLLGALLLSIALAGCATHESSAGMVRIVSPLREDLGYRQALRVEVRGGSADSSTDRATVAGMLTKAVSQAVSASKMFSRVLDIRASAEGSDLSLVISIELLNHVSASSRFWSGGAHGPARLHTRVMLVSRLLGLLSEAVIETPPASTCYKAGLLGIVQCRDVTTTENNVDATARYVVRFLRGRGGV
jgi:hypothetical protein